MDRKATQSLYTQSKYYIDIVETATKTEKELDLLESIFEDHGVESVLDVACGVGRHVIPLAKHGYDLTGVDISPDQLEEASKRARKAGTDVEFVQGDVNEYVSDKDYDAAICMLSTLGEGPLQYHRVIENVYQSLSNDGIFVIDNTSWENIPADREETWGHTIDASDAQIKTSVHDRFTRQFRIREVETTIQREDGNKTYEDWYITHILDEDDWKEELRRVGFEAFETYHDHEPAGKDNPSRISIVASKNK